MQKCNQQQPMRELNGLWKRVSLSSYSISFLKDSWNVVSLYVMIHQSHAWLPVHKINEWRKQLIWELSRKNVQAWGTKASWPWKFAAFILWSNDRHCYWQIYFIASVASIQSIKIEVKQAEICMFSWLQNQPKSAKFYFANEHNFLLGLKWKSVLHPKTQ